MPELPERKQPGDDLAAAEFNALVGQVRMNMPRTGTTTLGGTVIPPGPQGREPDKLGVVQARIIAAVTNNTQYLGYRIDAFGNDYDGMPIFIHTDRYPGAGNDNLREMVPWPRMTGQVPPPPDDMLRITRRWGVDANGNRERQWWATATFIGTCAPQPGEASNTNSLFRAFISRLRPILSDEQWQQIADLPCCGEDGDGV